MKTVRNKWLLNNFNEATRERFLKKWYASACNQKKKREKKKKKGLKNKNTACISASVLHRDCG